MARSSILGADTAPTLPAGKDVESLGPSDLSDTGSDVQGTLRSDETEDSLQQEIQRSDSDTGATGDRASAILSENVRDGADISPDQIVSSPDGAPLGDEIGLDDEEDEAA
jgi:hypothetical protein